MFGIVNITLMTIISHENKNISKIESYSVVDNDDELQCMKQKVF